MARVRPADDLTLIAESWGDLQNMVNAIDRACKRWGMSISATKSKILTVGKQRSSNPPSIMLAEPTTRRGGVLPLSWK